MACPERWCARRVIGADQIPPDLPARAPDPAYRRRIGRDDQVCRQHLSRDEDQIHQRDRHAVRARRRRSQAGHQRPSAPEKVINGPPQSLVTDVSGTIATGGTNGTSQIPHLGNQRRLLTRRWIPRGLVDALIPAPEHSTPKPQPWLTTPPYDMHSMSRSLRLRRGW